MNDKDEDDYEFDDDKESYCYICAIFGGRLWPIPVVAALLVIMAVAWSALNARP